MFSKIGIKAKILFVGIIPIMLIALINTFVVINFKKVLDDYRWVDNTREIIEVGHEIIQDAINMETGERGYIITNNDSFLEPFYKGISDYKGRFEKIKPLVHDFQANKHLVKAQEKLFEWENSVALKLIEARKEAKSDAKKISGVYEAVASKKGKVVFDEFRSQMQLFFEREKSLLQERKKIALSSSSFTNNAIVFGTLGVLIVAILLMLFVSKIVTTPMLLIRDAAKKISKGESDITLNIESKDEIGEMADSFKEMIQRLNEAAQTANKLSQGDISVHIEPFSSSDILGNALKQLVENLNAVTSLAHQMSQGDLNVQALKRSENDVLGGALENLVQRLNTILYEIKESTAILGSASNEIMATSAQVSASVIQTSSAVSQTSASIDEIKQTAKASSSRAIKTAQSTEHSLESSQKGIMALEDNMQGLNLIKDKMDLIASNIVELSEQSQLIGEIISTVEDIANQSNLLAVNASIEAVRAGENGKGFSVVAQELKNLAEQSKGGTLQVQKILTEIQKMSTTLVMVAEQGANAVSNGIEQAKNAKESISELNQSALEAARAGKQIAASYEQELAGMEQISGAMSSVKEAMGQNTDSIRQVEESARNLNTLSQKLSSILAQYRVNARS